MYKFKKLLFAFFFITFIFLFIQIKYSRAQPVKCNSGQGECRLVCNSNENPIKNLSECNVPRLGQIDCCVPNSLTPVPGEGSCYSGQGQCRLACNSSNESAIKNQPECIVPRLGQIDCCVLSSIVGILPTGPPIPGVSCGIPSKDPKNNSCCYYVPAEVNLPRPGLPFVDQLVGVLEWGVNLFTSPVLNIINQYGQDLVKPCVEGQPTTSDPRKPECRCVLEAPLNALLELCNFVNPKEKTSCENCLKGVKEDGTEDHVGVWTGLGCLKANVNTFIQETVLRLGIGLAGLFALLCIIYAAIIMQTSSGNPERIKKAQELLTSCIMGLMLIIFSVFILRLIGVDILKIPGFTN